MLRRRDDEPAATDASTTSTTAASATPLEGRWTTQFTDPNGLPPGTWVLQVHGTSAELTNPRQPGAPFDLGSPLVVDAQTVTLAPDPDCPGQAAVGEGVYRFEVSGASLTFTADHDSCTDRTATLTTHPWTRSG